ncbi:MAG: hypothetical protein GW939_04110 [Candidatus Magasanikbacteria bacterium]|uniref:Uncharacterized protein n=1 Tax=Candidatus Magasanikbacteria bacterium CG10_big_fil_rev_8_21_14_0_10_38_6 TaxID=1974647 RepID=A0A2M6P1L2_9BACT|nr:hypothetical protein [Candidatus Magasanikbacteria bacterium]PIR77310.1 MAG: hypothetical protein COU30_03160 [Candidatus Magasanikbacteria bacterium CG10_big_fil_rev_8_21_14_0_10_38_6]
MSEFHKQDREFSYIESPPEIENGSIEHEYIESMVRESHRSASLEDILLLRTLDNTGSCIEYGYV